jgi:hypothetical protein
VKSDGLPADLLQCLKSKPFPLPHQIDPAPIRQPLAPREVALPALEVLEVVGEGVPVERGTGRTSQVQAA